MQVAALTMNAPAQADAPLAQDRLEQAFLEEMLKYCNLQKGKDDFSGGYGEEHFSSFLTREYAARLSARLDLGLGELR
ncbi:chemotaxis protein chel [Paracoccus methylarcula]|uniref:Chemotaxis protein chel n=1 Tax=Paracoccus methylarcula TaxID=72022 RepID=A0A3R7PPK3_9RHOB|nr:chemotaxis protein chel [Paracoccus methylarcula]RNF34445.1 chemotaxis protein chel [Paracoccus methylarcula]